MKAANILTTKTGDVKLSDFGVSLNMKLKDNCGTDEDDSISGTPNWSTLTYKIPIYSATYPRLTDFAVAPEVIALKGASTSSDIW